MFRSCILAAFGLDDATCFIHIIYRDSDETRFGKTERTVHGNAELLISRLFTLISLLEGG